MAVEFDGRIAAVARDETGGQYQDEGGRASCIDRLFRPGRAYGANSTRCPPTLLPSCSSVSVPLRLRVEPTVFVI